MARKFLKFVITKIKKLFDHYFSSFFQGYSIRHKKISLDLGGGSKDLTKSFLYFFKEKMNKFPALRKLKIKRLNGLSHPQLIIKGTFHHGRKTS